MRSSERGSTWESCGGGEEGTGWRDAVHASTTSACRRRPDAGTLATVWFEMTAKGEAESKRLLPFAVQRAEPPAAQLARIRLPRPVKVRVSGPPILTRGTNRTSASTLAGGGRRSPIPRRGALRPTETSPSVQVKAPHVVTRPQRLDGIFGYRGGWRHLRQRSAIGAQEPQRAVRLPRDLVALLVHCSMMPPTEQEEIRQGGGPALRPVAHVMPLADPHVAAREATRPVPMLQRSP